MDHSVTPSVGRRSASSLPYVLFGGSLLLLVALFAVSYGVGRLAGRSRHARGTDDPDMGGMGHGGGR